MKAIRPVYDSLNDLDNLESIDYIDMMVCMFSQINERINAMTDVDEEQKNVLRHLVDKEILPDADEVIKNEKGKTLFFIPENEDDFEFSYGTEFDEIIVMFEITRWLEENGYEWDTVVTAKYQYIARVLGIFSDSGNYTVGAPERDEYVLNVEHKAFHELKLMLPLHWATILLDWYPVLINGIDGKEMIEFGNIMIACSEKGYHYEDYSGTFKRM